MDSAPNPERWFPLQAVFYTSIQSTLPAASFLARIVPESRGTQSEVQPSPLKAARCLDYCEHCFLAPQFFISEKEVLKVARKVSKTTSSK